MTKVLLVITGDTNGDGRVSAPDIARLNAHIKANGLIPVMTAEQQFAADVNYDNLLNDADKAALTQAILGREPLSWNVANRVEE